MDYNLEIPAIIKEIKKQKAQRILLQLPDGLKPKAEEIVNEIEKNTNAEIYIWFGSCFGACDLPLGIQQFNIDLLIQFGHTKFNKEKW